MSLKEYYVINDRILIKPAKNQEQKDRYAKTKGSLIFVSVVPHHQMPEAPKLELTRGFVVLKGPGYPLFSEKNTITDKQDAVFIPLKVTEGDEVLFYSNVPGVFQLTLEEELYFLIRNEHILIGKANNFN